MTQNSRTDINENTSPSLQRVPKEDLIKKIHDPFMLLMRVSKRWVVQQLQEFSMTLPQFVTLAALAAYKQPCTMSDLTNATIQDAPTTTGVVDRLIKVDLVERTRSQTDRRVVLVKATQPGIELINQIEQKFIRESVPVYAHLTEEELITFERLLRRLLRANMQQYMSPEGADIDAEIERLEQFVKDPISYSKIESSATD
jgi:DNA-binding MarR family transcriptional regulator